MSHRLLGAENRQLVGEIWILGNREQGVPLVRLRERVEGQRIKGSITDPAG